MKSVYAVLCRAFYLSYFYQRSVCTFFDSCQSVASEGICCKDISVNYKLRRLFTIICHPIYLTNVPENTAGANAMKQLNLAATSGRNFNAINACALPCECPMYAT